MALRDIRLLEERVNLRTLLITLMVAALGIGFLYVSARKDWLKGYEPWQTVIRDVGSLLLVTVAITLLWELWAKRAFLDEVLAKVQLAQEIKLAGLVRVTDVWHRDIDWPSLFRNVNKLDIFFAYGHTWRSNNDTQLKKLAAKKEARIRVVLPDPQDKQTVSELARRFNQTPEQLRRSIREAEKYFRDLGCISAGSGAQINIWCLPAAPLFAFYRFDRIAVLTLYSHSRQRTPVPTFVVEMGGTLYDYIRKEFDAMISPGGLAKLFTPEEK